MTEDRKACVDCGLEYEEGAQAHDGGKDCIRALRKAMLRQREVATDLGLTISLQFLRALEELAVDPSVGYQYTTFDPESGKRDLLPPQAVSGIFSSILKKYRELGNWKPLQEAKEQAGHFAGLAGTALGSLVEIVAIGDDKDDGRVTIDPVLATELHKELERLMRLGVHPTAVSHAQS